MNAKTVRNPMTLRNALSEHPNGERIKAIIQAANTSKLRYPLLILTFALLVAVVIMSGRMLEGIFAAWPN